MSSPRAALDGATSGRPETETLRLSVVIPVYNEAGTVIDLLERVAGFRHPAVAAEVLVVDDGSNDGSAALLDGRPELYTRLIRHAVNRGKGAAVASAVSEATGEFILIQDADLEYSPSDYAKLLDPVLEGRADVVFSRRSEDPGGSGGGVRVLSAYSLARMVFSALCGLFSGWRIHDVAACLKVLARDHLVKARLRERGFALDPEIALKVARIPGARFAEVPISYRPRSSAEGKKLRWWHGVPYALAILRYGVPCLFVRPARARGE